MGFAVPLARWFRGPLRQRVRDAVLGDRLAATAGSDHGFLGTVLDEHHSGARDHSVPLWSLLMFEAFLRGLSTRHRRGPPRASGGLMRTQANAAVLGGPTR